MAYQHKEGQGSLFKNEKQNERQPDFRGSIMIKGVTYNISAWNRTSQNGRQYLSLQAEEQNGDARPNYNGGAGYSSQPGGYGPSGPGYGAPRSGYDAPGSGFDSAPAYNDIPENDLPF